MNFKANNEYFWDFVSHDANVTLAATGYIFTEGPVWSKEGFLLFSDIPGNTIYKLTSDGKSTPYITPSGNSNGLTFDSRGNLVACEHSGRKIVVYDKYKKATVLVDNFNGKRLNSPNDIVFRKDGGFYFSDPPYGLKNLDSDSTKELKINGLYLFANNKLTLIDSSYKRPNGVALSPDEKTLYVAQSEFFYFWKAYQLDDKGSILSDKILMQQPDITGNPDGIKVDVEGNIYCTGNGGVVIFDKMGNYLGTINIPENPSNLCFGDADLKTLYVTAQKSVYKIKLKKKGHLAY
ncbi:MAG: SMP-30/gluconolactonase/LRE family protein [Cytophagales bacterium]